jgi:hypothetical protein
LSSATLDWSMNSSFSFEPICREIDFLLHESSMLRATGPRIQILYHDHESRAEVAMVSLVHRSRIYPLRLAPGARILFDYLAKHRLPQSAAQIQAGIHSLYGIHPFDGGGTRRRARRLSHLKVHVQRIRIALAQAFRDAGIAADPYRVLISEPADGKTVLYSMRCSIEWLIESLPHAGCAKHVSHLARQQNGREQPSNVTHQSTANR